YWHPHNYEILSGTLVLPGLPEPVEREALESKVNSYGKTWHVWMTGVHGRTPDPLPYGPPRLAWSFNRDGELDPALLGERDRRMGVSTSEKREARAGLSSLARPQGGVDAMGELFPGAGGAPAGVRDDGSGAGRDVPDTSEP